MFFALHESIAFSADIFRCLVSQIVRPKIHPWKRANCLIIPALAMASLLLPPATTRSRYESTCS